MWSVCGGFLLYFLTSNYLSVLLKPSYGIPVETSGDVIARDLRIIAIPGSADKVFTDKESEFPMVHEIARRTWVTGVISLIYFMYFCV